jgi:hypothetical protein
MSYRFERTAYVCPGAKRCTYCPSRPGELCRLSCAGNYQRLQAERAADGVIVNDEL